MANGDWYFWKLRLIPSSQTFNDSTARTSDLSMLRQMRCSHPVRSLFLDTTTRLAVCAGANNISLWHFTVDDRVEEPTNASQIQVIELEGMNALGVARCTCPGQTAANSANGAIQRIVVGVKGQLVQRMLNFRVPAPTWKH
mmetsp:Transcript_24053/g.35192  ORF Transcript_24053/g.35192 Transcript_24053/m.35192 type:complete len:141 (-) Transcript_24053:73-495(-)